MDPILPARDYGHDRRPEVAALFSNLKRALPELKSLLERNARAEDAVYRFYYGSFKVYGLQSRTLAIVEALKALSPERSLDAAFLKIVREGTGKRFELEHNQRWLEETRPILEAFFHARYFLEMAVIYGDALERPPTSLPSGWAALLCLFNLR